MLRIKEPNRSLQFYTGVLGMTLLAKLDFPDMKVRAGWEPVLGECSSTCNMRPMQPRDSTATSQYDPLRA